MADYEASVEIQVKADQAINQTNKLNNALGGTVTTGTAATGSVKGFTQALKTNSIVNFGNALKNSGLNVFKSNLKATCSGIGQTVKALAEMNKAAVVTGKNIVEWCQRGFTLGEAFNIEVNALVAETANIGDKIKNVALNVKNLFKNLTPFITKITGLLALSVRQAIKVAAEADDIADSAKKLHMSTTAYQEWGYVLEQNGVEISTLNTSMRTFAKLVANGDEVLKTYEITSGDVSEAFEQAIFKIQTMERETDKITALTELFGSRASELMPVLEMTNEDTKALMETYRLIGGTMSNELIAKGDVLTDSITEMKAAFKGLRNVVFQGLIEPLTKAVQRITVGVAKMSILITSLFNIETSYDWLTDIGDEAEEDDDKLKALKRTILGFDELNILDSNTDDSDDSDSEYDTVSGSIFTSDVIDELTAFKKELEGMTGLQKIFKVLSLEDKSAVEKMALGLLGARGVIKLLTRSFTDKNNALDEQTNKTKVDAGALASVLVPAAALAATGISVLTSNIKDYSNTEIPALAPQVDTVPALTAFGELSRVADQLSKTHIQMEASLDTSAVVEGIQDAQASVTSAMDDLTNSLQNLDKINVKPTVDIQIKTNSEPIEASVSTTGGSAIQTPSGAQITNKKASSSLSSLVNSTKIAGITTAIAAIGSLILNAFSTALTGMPAFASGGVLTTPTIGLMGEYAGVRANPEIVTPQNTMSDVFSSVIDNRMSGLLSAIERNTQAIQNKSTDVYLNSMKISRQVSQDQKTISHYSGTNYVVQGG